MASSLPPVRGSAYTFPISLVSQADTDIFQTGVTITTADVWVSKDGGAFAAATAAPTELLTTPGGANTGVLWQGLTATEMTADIVAVLYHDAAGSQWQDALVMIYTAGQTLDTTDGVADTISGKVIGTLATGTHNPQSGDAYATLGAAGAGLTALGDTRLANLDTTVSSRAATGAAMTLADSAITSAKFASGAITAASIAADAIGASELAADAVTEIQSGLSTLTAQNVADALKLAPTAGDPATGSVNKHLDDIITATTAIQAKTDLMDVTGVTVVSVQDGDKLTVYAGATFDTTISGLTIASTWTKCYFTVKRTKILPDAQAIVQIVESNPGADADGLLYLNAASATAAQGSLTVSQAGGTVAIVLADNASVLLAERKKYYWDLKTINSGGDTDILCDGTLDVEVAVTQTI